MRERPVHGGAQESSRLGVQRREDNGRAERRAIETRLPDPQLVERGEQHGDEIGVAHRSWRQLDRDATERRCQMGDQRHERTGAVADAVDEEQRLTATPSEEGGAMSRGADFSDLRLDSPAGERFREWHGGGGFDDARLHVHR